jgi:hypothetical protein
MRKLSDSTSDSNFESISEAILRMDQKRGVRCGES